MNAIKRREEILRILNNRRFEKVDNLAIEFSVTRRTILHDISFLSEMYPIYTSPGVHGGVFLMKNCNLDKNKLTDEQRKFLQKLIPLLSEKERKIMSDIIKQFS